jgi:hypothetical protein
VSERPKERASKACVGETQPWVQIPPPPPPPEKKLLKTPAISAQDKGLSASTRVVNCLLSKWVKNRNAYYCNYRGQYSLDKSES